MRTITYADMLRDLEISSEIDLFKMDIEGHEYSLLNSIAPSDLININAIQFEFGGANIDSRTYFRDFWNLLSDYFTIYRMTKFGLAKIARYREIDETLMTTNYLCVKRRAV